MRQILRLTLRGGLERPRLQHRKACPSTGIMHHRVTNGTEDGPWRCMACTTREPRGTTGKEKGQQLQPLLRQRQKSQPFRLTWHGGPERPRQQRRRAWPSIARVRSRIANGVDDGPWFCEARTTGKPRGMMGKEWQQQPFAATAAAADIADREAEALRRAGAREAAEAAERRAEAIRREGEEHARSVKEMLSLGRRIQSDW